MRAIYVYNRDSDRTVLARGQGLGQWLRRNDLPGPYNSIEGGYEIRRDRLSDLEAACKEGRVKMVVSTERAPKPKRQ